MSKLSIDQKSVRELLSDKKSDFLIPDYQRPYAWTEDECATLWDDLFAFAFPDYNTDKFDADSDEYFLGPIVTFKNEEGKLEVIDGQQRLTTLMLLLRAFYSRFEHAQDSNSIDTKNIIAQCVWKTNEFGNPDMNRLKIDSQVAADDDKDEFLSILKNGHIDNSMKSRYARTYRFFQERIKTFIDEYPMYTALLPIRILNNVILLPIEAGSQDTALRIFSTLNDRGLPLSDADIFKSQFYKYYSGQGKKDEFISRWRDLEATANEVFNPQHGTPMDELFTRYMYYERAKQGNRNTTTEALRDFYEKEGYQLLKNDVTLTNLEKLAEFWQKIDHQDNEFSDRILERLFVLNYAPNGMWTYLVSVYFMQYKDEEGKLEEAPFYEFLSKITGFVFAYAIERPGVNALRSPVYPEMINIVNERPVTFENYRFNRGLLGEKIKAYSFNNGRPITKSMLTWWAFQNENQVLLNIDDKFEIEHIFAKQRANIKGALSNQNNLEALGNKAILEKGLNIRASDYRFDDKKKYYLGYVDKRGNEKPGTNNKELQELATGSEDFTEQDIVNRTNLIIESFLDYLESCNLLQL